MRGIEVGVVIAGVAVASWGCGGAPQGQQTRPADESRRYPLRGVVVSVDLETGAAGVAHEEIPGYMGAMTMRIPILDEDVLGQLKEGDRITGTLVVSPDNRYWLEEVVVESRDATKPQAGDGGPSEGPAAQNDSE